MSTLHNRRDSALSVVKAIPAAGANANTGTIDIGSANGAVLDRIEIEVSVPALPNLVGTDKYLTIKIQDSADNITFADVEQCASFAIVGVASTGTTAAVQSYRLPSDTKRYVQANLAVTSAGGDSTAKSVTVSVLS